METSNAGLQEANAELQKTNTGLEKRLTAVELDKASLQKNVKELEDTLQTTMGAVIGVSNPFRYRCQYYLLTYLICRIE